MNLSTRAILLTSATLLALSASACSKNDKDGKGGDAAADTKKGLDAPDNDPAFVAATKAVLETCGPKWDAKKGFDDCEALAAYREKKFESIDPTLVNVIEDEDAKKRWFGVLALGSWGSTYRKDKALAGRVAAALENEKPGSPIDVQLAYMAASAEESAGVRDRLKAHGMKPTTALDVKYALAVWLTGEGGYAITKALSTLTDKASVRATVNGYSAQFVGHDAEACQYWTAHLEDDDKDVRTDAVARLTGGWRSNRTRDAESGWSTSGGGNGPSSSGNEWCTPAQVDAALSAIGKRVDANTIENGDYCWSLSNVVRHPKSTDAQKKVAVAALKKIVETKGASYRSFALRELVNVKPDEKAFALKFVSDPDLKSVALDLTKPKSGAEPAAGSAAAKAAPPSTAAAARPATPAAPVAKAAPKK